jgi:hypothetical protein
MTWTPRELPRHINAWWWDASYAPSFTFTGAGTNEIATWKDRLRGLALARDGTAGPFVLRDTNHFAQRRVFFDGNGGLRSSLSSVVLSDTGSMAVWAVARYTSARTNQRIVSYAQDAGNDFASYASYIPLLRPAGADELGNYHQGFCAVVPYAVGTRVMATSVMVEGGGAVDVFSISLNGASPVSHLAVNPLLASVGRFGIGVRADGWDSADSLVGDIYEVIIVSGRVTAQLNATVQQYLSAKWRIALASRQRVRIRNSGTLLGDTLASRLRASDGLKVGAFTGTPTPLIRVGLG